MSTTILSYAGWAFLPNLVTGWLQSIYYGIAIRAGDPKPQPGTPRYQKHRRRIHMIVVISYLLYTLFEADYWVREDKDFYQILGVTPDVGEKIIKSKFRRLFVFFNYRTRTWSSLTCFIELRYIIQTKYLQKILSYMPRLKHISSISKPRKTHCVIPSDASHMSALAPTC